ncbi:MAG: HD domain-containing protein [Chloroflexi bacterium]|nr:MAG: HD domain-containing protein [Chloroflexota bacterium]
MVKTIYIANLKAGDYLENEPFLLVDVARRTTRDGRPYLLYTLRDKTGQINGVFWDVPEYIDNWAQAGLGVLVTGRVTNYKDALQIAATDFHIIHNPDLTEFLPSSRRSRQEMLAELHQIVSELNEPWQSLVSHILLQEPFLTQFANAPAARNMHHAFIGGLLEHTLSMAAIAKKLAEHYPYVNKDLLLAGVLLHDMGKTAEYTTDGAFAYTEDGLLVGHIIRAIAMIERAAAQLGTVSEEDLRHLVHLVASHHGTLEWGSPVTPKTLEAILLHQIDLLDSRVQGFFDHLKNDTGGEDWTARYSPMFNTMLRRPAGYDEGEETAES